MKKSRWFAFVFAGLVILGAGQGSGALASGFMASARPTGLVRHIVAFRFAPSVTARQKVLVTEQFLAMKARIPSIVSLEAGVNNSPEGLDKGFTHVYIVTFKNAADRDEYVYRNPVHASFKKLVGRLLDGGANGVIVLDFDATEAL